jgi:hypothetical protein
MDKMFTVAIGNPFDGVSLHGVFETFEDAFKYMEKCDDDCWIVEIENA